eukprot:TRINITY_DN4517_c0_g1_i2.p2 TRINITY_DN4517_c0_g1~~TRINITY_DN4517_c0_g1_i2.p2  ORF type:complete len:169 (-),score=34.45 TRINITY_DN4517_c0_g1_i2:163-609(-)
MAPVDIAGSPSLKDAVSQNLGELPEEHEVPGELELSGPWYPGQELGLDEQLLQPLRMQWKGSSSAMKAVRSGAPSWSGVLMEPKKMTLNVKPVQPVAFPPPNRNYLDTFGVPEEEELVVEDDQIVVVGTSGFWGTPQIQRKKRRATWI